MPTINYIVFAIILLCLLLHDCWFGNQFVFFLNYRAKQALGSCVRLTAFPRDVFCRVLLLFTMNVIPDDQDTTNSGQAQQL